MTELEKEYISVIESIGDKQELRFLRDFLGHEQEMREMIDFIQEKKIDCNSLWKGDGIERENSYRDYLLLMMKELSLKNKKRVVDIIYEHYKKVVERMQREVQEREKSEGKSE